MEFGIGDRKIRIKRHLALRIDVTGDQEMKCTVANGNRSFAPGQEALAKSSEWVRPADGSFPGSMLNVSLASESMREFP